MKTSSSLLFFLLEICVVFHISYADPGVLKPRFNYSNPTKWGKISPEFAGCASGRRQSPINIISRNSLVNKELGPLESYYHVQNASLISNGVSLQVVVEAKSELVINGIIYRLAQMHWHTPSEHRINNIQFAAELHQVHKAEDGSTAVISILYEYGKPDPLVSAIGPYMYEMGKKHRSGYDGVNVPKFRSTLIKERGRSYYRYSGSFTTPPCTEPVMWNVISKARTISKEQVVEMRRVLDAVNRYNARPVQPLNGRIVHRYV